MCVCMGVRLHTGGGVCRITPQNYKLSRIMVYVTRYFFDTSFGLCAFLGFLNFCGLSDSQAKNGFSALHFTHLALIF